MNEYRFLSRWSRRKHRSREASAAASTDVAGSEAVARARPDEAPRWPDEHRPREPGQRSGEADGQSARGRDEQRAREPDQPVPGAGHDGESARSKPDDASAPGAGSQPIAGERRPLPPIESLTTASDFRPFMQQGVDALTRNSALKRLFADPHFNVMDGLDVYIDDYNKTEPIPPALLATLKQLHEIGKTDDAQDDRPGDEPAVGTQATEATSAEAQAAEAPAAEAPADAPLARSDYAGHVPVAPDAVRDEKSKTRTNPRESSMNDQPTPEEPAE